MPSWQSTRHCNKTFPLQVNRWMKLGLGLSGNRDLRSKTGFVLARRALPALTIRLRLYSFAHLRCLSFSRNAEPLLKGSHLSKKIEQMKQAVKRKYGSKVQRQTCAGAGEHVFAHICVCMYSPFWVFFCIHACEATYSACAQYCSWSAYMQCSW